MANKRDVVSLVEASKDRFVVDIPLGRVIIEPSVVRFHKNGRGRGVIVIPGDEPD